MPDPIPPLTFIPDTVEDSELEHQYTTSQKVRGGLVIGLSGDPSSAVDQIIAAPGMPKFGDTLLVNGRTLYLRTIRAKATGSDSARVVLVYNNDFGATFNSAYIIRDNAYLAPYRTNLVPGTRVPLRIPAWTNPKVDNDIIPGDNVTFTIQRPLREIEVSGVMAGTPPSDDKYEKYIGYANSDTFKGLAPGWWLLTNGGIDLSKYKGFYNFHLTALTRNTEDWSETGILRDVRNGLYAIPDPSFVTTVVGLPYQQGIIIADGGMLRWGPYPTTAFAPLFGFSNTGFGNILVGL